MERVDFAKIQFVDFGTSFAFFDREAERFLEMRGAQDWDNARQFGDDYTTGFGHQTRYLAEDFGLFLALIPAKYQ